MLKLKIQNNRQMENYKTDTTILSKPLIAKNLKIITITSSSPRNQRKTECITAKTSRTYRIRLRMSSLNKTPNTKNNKQKKKDPNCVRKRKEAVESSDSFLTYRAMRKKMLKKKKCWNKKKKFEDLHKTKQMKLKLKRSSNLYPKYKDLVTKRMKLIR